MTRFARPFVGLLLVAVALAATPWEGLAVSDSGASTTAALGAERQDGKGGDGAGEAGCCICLCSHSPSPLLPASASATATAVLLPKDAIVLRDLAPAPALHARLVFHPPRRA